MKIVVQTDDFELLEEAVQSGCDGVRFGSEFCEYKLPTQQILEKAYEITQKKGKEFTYMTPRVSNSGIENVRKQLTFLNKEGISVVFNDLGTFHMLRQCETIRKRLGRQLIRIPARSPWAERIARNGIILAKQVDTAYYQLTKGNARMKHWYKQLFAQTSLNYLLTIEFFKASGVRNVDIDWIPHILPSFSWLMHHELKLAVYLQLTPISVTRKCHTARFIGEEIPEKCSKPCLNKTYLLRHETQDSDLFLLGNVVNRWIPLTRNDLMALVKMNVAELVLIMNAITHLTNHIEIDAVLKRLTL